MIVSSKLSGGWVNSGSKVMQTLDCVLSRILLRVGLCKHVKSGLLPKYCLVFTAQFLSLERKTLSWNIAELQACRRPGSNFLVNFISKTSDEPKTIIPPVARNAGP